MTIQPDHWIRKMAKEHGMIEPFVEGQKSNGVISYGVSSYGYDIRVADEFKIFTNVFSAIVDPKHFDPKSMVDFKGEVCIIPPNSFVLARTIEYFRIPRNVLTICLGKCLTGDTRIIDEATGDYLPLKDFVARQRPGTLSLAGWRLRAGRVTAHINNGVQPVYELTTRAGLRIKATATHPFRTFDGWKPLAELQIGQRIAAARTCPVFGKEDWPEHEAILLGLLLADGQCHTPGHSPRYTTGDPRLAEVFTEAARAFGCDVSPVGRMGYNLVNRRGRGGVAEKNRAYVWLAQFGCNVQSRNKFVPPIVFKARRERVAAFLRALFSGDGSAYRSGRSVFLEYSSISQRLIEDVRHLLLRFGIFALMRSKALPSGGVAYRVQITDRDMIQRFAQEVGFIPGSHKQQALDDILADIAARPKCKSNFDTLPPAAWQTMRAAVHASGRSLAAVGIRSAQPNQSLPYALATQAAQIIENPQFSALLESDVVWDTVESITAVGEEVVYDLTVPGVHNFLANDLVVHNSTYARCGLIVNVTPFEPEWEGYVTLEISNTTPLPAKVYANEGIAQVVFFVADQECEVSYKDRKGKYDKQTGVVLPRIIA
jgi:deoxycytidine triphosphate deaminase